MLKRATLWAMLLSVSIAMAAQGASGLSCEPENPTSSGSMAASPDSEPQCWEGTLNANGQGGAYNDTAEGRFKFTVADDNTVNGTAHIRMSHAPQMIPRGCTYTRSQDPDEFDVAIDGRSSGDRLELNFGSTKAMLSIGATCPHIAGQSRTVTAPSAFTGNSDSLLHPARVPTEDGSTTLRGSIGGGYRLIATLQISCKRGCILPRAAD